MQIQMKKYGSVELCPGSLFSLWIEGLFTVFKTSFTFFQVSVICKLLLGFIGMKDNISTSKNDLLTARRASTHMLALLALSIWHIWSELDYNKQSALRIMKWFDANWNWERERERSIQINCNNQTCNNQTFPWMLCDIPSKNKNDDVFLPDV